MENCSQHSGICANVENLKDKLSETNLSLERHKGYIDGKFERVDVVIKELTEKIEKAVTKIEEKIDKQIETRSKKSWMIICQVVIPFLAVFLGIMGEHYIGK